MDTKYCVQNAACDGCFSRWPTVYHKHRYTQIKRQHNCLSFYCLLLTSSSYSMSPPSKSSLLSLWLPLGDTNYTTEQVKEQRNWPFSSHSRKKDYFLFLAEVHKVEVTNSDTFIPLF